MGVRLESGEEIHARAVASNADPRRTFLGLLEASALPNDFRTAMQRTIDWYMDNQNWWRAIKASEDYQNYYRRQYAQR